MRSLKRWRLRLTLPPPTSFHLPSLPGAPFGAAPSGATWISTCQPAVGVSISIDVAATPGAASTYSPTPSFPASVAPL